MLGESTCGVFREDEDIVHNDIENATAPLNQLDIGTCLRLHGVRQTGGLRRVVSLHAIRDRNLLHGNSLLELKYNVTNMCSIAGARSIAVGTF